MQVNLAPDLEKMVQDQLASGPYGSVDEVIREALRLLEKWGRRRDRELGRQQARVAGSLNVPPPGEVELELVLASGHVITITPEMADLGTVSKLDGQTVIVSGQAVFRPSGRLDRIEAESIRKAEGDVSFWLEAPKSLFVPLDSQELHGSQEPGKAILETFGRWPGDESDDEIFAALEALS